MSMANGETMHLPPGPPPRNHGRTVAAWTTTAAVIVGAVVVAVGMIGAFAVVVWCGAGVIVLGLIVGAVLAIMGHGQGGAPDAADHGTAAPQASSDG